jgi:HlyD family secretion protein
MKNLRSGAGETSQLRTGILRRPYSGILRYMALVAVLAIAIAIALAYLWHSKSHGSPQYATVQVSRGAVAPAVISSGTVNPVTTIQVGTYVSGVIMSLSCDFNTRVHAGQLCATIDARPYQSAVDQAAANLAIARAQLKKDRAALAFARLIYERNTGLLQRGIVSQETVDTARNVYDQAQTQIALDQATIMQHEALLKAASINLGYTNIVSPVDGTVVSRNVTQGQTVAASFQTPTLFLIATDLTKMQVDTNVSESDIGRVAPGNTALFSVETYPDRQFAGTVQQVRQAPQTVQNVVTYDVVVSVANADLALKPGMTASMRIVTSRADNVLRVPDQALRYMPSETAKGDDRQASGSNARHARQSAPAAPVGDSPARKGRPGQVWVLADHRPRRVPVVVGLDDDAYAEIMGGELHEGDAVIISERADASQRPVSGSAGPRMPRF